MHRGVLLRFKISADFTGVEMDDVIAVWRADHVNYSRLLDVLEEQVAAFHAGRTPDYGLMRDVVSYLRHFPDRFHHPREDAAFACLLELDPNLRLPINRLLQEHRVIAVAGEELLNRLNEVVAEALVERAGLEAAAALFLAYYRHHIATEEREILPRAAKMLTRDDWRIVANAVSSARDPLFGDGCEERYRELRKQIAAKAGG